MLNKGITILGMPGSGKTTIGKLLARDLKLKFLDLDRLIKEKTSITPNDYLNKYGENELLKLEEALTLGLKLKNKVFSPGGSIIYMERAMKKIKKETLIVYLKLPLEILKNRIKNIDTRAIVGLKSHGLDNLYSSRSPLYAEYADFTVRVVNEKPVEVKKMLLDKLKEEGDDQNE